jgi:hypothetical protein
MLFALVEVLQNVFQLNEYEVFPWSCDHHKDNGQATY